MTKVLCVNWMPEELIGILHSLLPRELTLTTIDREGSPQVVQELPETDVILVADAPVTREMILRAPRLKLIQHMGVGYDNVDVEAARERQIPVCCTPSGTIVGVAEHTILLILAVLRKLLVADRSLREGKFLRWQLRTQSYELSGKTLGIIGFGRIGREVAQRAKSFGCRILYYDPYARLNLVEQNKLNVQPRSFEQLLIESDVVTLHTPLTHHTKNMIGEAELKLMKSTSILINTARGKLVDEPALLRALTDQQIAGAGLDVFWQEPVAKENPLLRLQNVVLTPHIATGTIDSFHAKIESCLRNMMRLVRSEQLRDRVA